MLDLFQQDQADSARIRPEEAPRLPATFGDTFGAAWSEALLFRQSFAGRNARMAALDDYLQEIERKTGEKIGPEMVRLDPEMVDPWGATNVILRDLKAKDPAFAFGPLTPAEIEERAVGKSREARADLAALKARERTAGGTLGLFLGSASGAAVDPINIAALPVAPAEGVSVLAAGLRWAAIGAATGGAIELAGLPFREEVEPGYSRTLEPVVNVAENAIGAGAVGGGVKLLGNAWTRVKTGAWPRSIRDAGNVVESEANIAQTNRLPGVDGEVAHRSALQKAIDDIVEGRAVDVDSIMPPGAWQEARRLVVRLEGDRNLALPQFDERVIRLMSEEAALRERDSLLQSQLEGLGGGDPAAVDTLARLAVIEQEAAAATGQARRDLLRRRDELLTDTTPERLRGNAAPIEARRVVEAERASIAERLAAVDAERTDLTKGSVYASPSRLGERPSRFESLLDIRRAAVRAGEEAKTEAAAAAQAAAPELPFAASAKQAEADKIVSAMADGIGAVARRAGYEMPAEEAGALAQRLLKATDEEAGAILDELVLRPRTIADTLPSASEAAAERRLLAIVDRAPLPPGTRIAGASTHGPMLEGLAGRWAEAVNWLRAARTGEALGVLRHPAVPGPIDVIWGNEGRGLLHIITKHPEIVDRVADILPGMTVQKATANRITLTDGASRAVVRLDYDGKAKNWLLTAFDLDREVPTRRGGGRTESSPEGAPGPARSPAPSSTDNITSVEGRRNYEAAMADQHTPSALEKLRSDPALDETVLRDLDRLRAERGDVEVPVGETTAATGERVVQTQKLESVLAEADARLAAAKEIEACTGPQPEVTE